MRFEYLSHSRIKVILSAKDISEAGLDLESNKQSDIKRLKGYLLLLFSKIRPQFDINECKDDTLYIEIHPHPDGEAVIYFIIDRKTVGLCEPLIFCFPNSDELINAAVTLYSSFSHRLYQSALYQSGSCWLLIVRPLDGSSGITERLLSEYGERIDGGSMTAAVIGEHCKPVIRERAADMLSFYFG